MPGGQSAPTRVAGTEGSRHHNAMPAASKVLIRDDMETHDIACRGWNVRKGDLERPLAKVEGVGWERQRWNVEKLFPGAGMPAVRVGYLKESDGFYKGLFKLRIFPSR